MLTTGIKGQKTVAVTESNCASGMQSGTLPVFATPAMIALLEGAAFESVQPYVGEGRSTVGTHLDIAHSSATPIGMAVTASTELVEIDRRRLVFKVEVTDGKGIIGSGTHERFIVDCDKFMSKAESKLE